MTTPFTAEQTFAALYQAVKPDFVGNRWERGYAWAMDSVRDILGKYRLDGSAESRLAVVEPAIREWLAAGPDRDSQEYNDGCLTGQDTIRGILDGDPEEVLSQLEDAAEAAQKLYAEARQRTGP
ncbi:hypothetical protein [Streptomyces javensis]|uniref:Uncharacterized protein n=1 Tax=Streptomyces javensis TaxID=114698 RepID=A0ABS0R6J7_9ACTN|nr:hypothetical protein [Streptomyces javensis]MBI0312700.1 hypothetical protein [Streptomyces javensis]